MISLEKISHSFQSKNLFEKKNQKKYALRNVSFTIAEGQMTGLVGHNGAGKSTLFKILFGLIRPSSGSIKVASHLPSQMNQWMVFLPEGPLWYPHLSGRKHLEYFSKLSDVKLGPELKEWSEVLRMDRVLDQKVYTYSKGMKQRLGILSTLVSSPKLMVLDEPFSGLDPLGRSEVKSFLKTIHKQGKSIFFSSHIMSDVEELCGEIIVLKNGHVVSQGPANQLNLKDDIFAYERSI